MLPGNYATHVPVEVVNFQRATAVAGLAVAKRIWDFIPTFEKFAGYDIPWNKPTAETLAARKKYNVEFARKYMEERRKAKGSVEFNNTEGTSVGMEPRNKRARLHNPFSDNVDAVGERRQVRANRRGKRRIYKFTKKSLRKLRK